MSERVPFGEKVGFRGIPPFPHPLKAATGAGFAKMPGKILSHKGLEVKILTTKDLGAQSSFSRVLPPP